MASLTAKKIHGRTYYYLRESAWVDGRPKIVRQTYLGSAEAIAAALGKRASPLELKAGAPVLKFGAVAALYDLARRLRLVELIDAHLPKRGRGPSVGTMILLAAINRAVEPTSKARLAQWYERTSLHRWLKIEPGQITSQRFWDNMNRIDEAALVAIERELTERVIQEYALDLRCLFYDATNFFTFIDSFNSRSRLAQRGKSKEGRSNLRILGLALLVTADFQVPLFHYLYPGNHNDPTSFRAVVEELASRAHLLAQEIEEITLVFDKGNNVGDALHQVGTAYRVVGSLVPSHHKDLLNIPRQKMQRLDPKRFPNEVRAFRTSKPVFDRTFTVLVTYNENLFEAQSKTIAREVAKCHRKLRAYQLKLRSRRPPKTGARSPSASTVRNKIATILRGQHMKDLFRIEIFQEGELPRFLFRFDATAYRKLQATLLGKTLLFTDHESWTDEDIVAAYRGQHHVEAAFRQMKDVRYLSFRPTFHWTDQKLLVHAFICVLALTLCSLLRRELHRKGVSLSMDAMLDALTSIQEVHVLLSSGSGRPRVQRTHSKLDPLAAKLFQGLGLDRYLAS